MSEITAERLAKSFGRVGWTGFWVQLFLSVTPVSLFGYFLFNRATGSTVRLGLTDYMALTGLFVLAFTTIWSLRYALLSKQIANPDKRPRRSRLAGVLWIGVWASVLGITISLVLMFIEVLRLLFLFMTAPQGGVPVVQTQVDSRTEWVSAMDVVSLLAELCTLTGELTVLGFALYLLFRVSQSPDSTPDPGVAQPKPGTGGEAA